MLPFCYTPRVVVHTVGHSTRTLAELEAILAAHGIAGVADVRRYPASRRHPQFAREALADALAATGRRYDWLPALGGRRQPQVGSPHTAWRNSAFRAYADHMDGAEFAAGIDALLALAAARATAILCAEAVPWRCHRQLIADALVARGVAVVHLLGPGAGRPHTLSPIARVVGERVVYDTLAPVRAIRHNSRSA